MLSSFLLVLLEADRYFVGERERDRERERERDREDRARNLGADEPDAGVD